MNAARIEMKIRSVGAPARTQYETQPGVWGEGTADGGVSVYREDGGWIGAADRNGHPQAMANPDRSGEETVIACSLVLLAKLGGGFVLVAKWGPGDKWAPAFGCLSSSTFDSHAEAIEQANSETDRNGAPLPWPVLGAFEWAAVPASVWKAATR